MVFILLLLLIVAISVFIINDENGPRQVSDYKIDCVADYTNHRSAYAGLEGISIFHYGTGSIYADLSKLAKLKLRDLCDISEEEANSSNQAVSNYVLEQLNAGTYKETIESEIDAKYRPYIITEAYRTEGSYTPVFGYSLLTIVIILLIAETLRRIFYYIILGTVRPNKKGGK